MSLPRTRRRTEAPGMECRCPAGYPITAFTNGEPVREHHRNLCGLPNENATDQLTERE